MQTTGPYVGIVVSNTDPAKLGRVKVSVPHVYGASDSTFQAIGVSDLPWAIPAGLPAGGSTASGGIDWLPDPGDQVIVFFLDGEPEKPVWMWMMQNLDQAKAFPLHHYSEKSAKGKPDRAALTRYGHTLELNRGSIVLSSKNGYQVYLLDGDKGLNNGRMTMQTPKSNMFELDDETDSCTFSVNRDAYFNVGSTFQMLCDDLDIDTLSGGFRLSVAASWDATVGGDQTTTVEGSVTRSVTGNVTDTISGSFESEVTGTYLLNSTGTMNLLFPTLTLGASASEPFVLGNQLTKLINTLVMWLSGHTHSNGNNGSPTGPPITPPQPEISPLLETILSETILGQ